MNSLGMLSQVVKAGKPARAMTLEWPLSGMFPVSSQQDESFFGLEDGLPDVPSEVLASGETKSARRVACAVEPLRLLLVVCLGICVLTLVVRSIRLILDVCIALRFIHLNVLGASGIM